MKFLIILIFIAMARGSVLNSLSSVKESRGCDVLKTRVSSIDTLETSLLFRCVDSSGSIQIRVEKENLGANVDINNTLIFSLISYIDGVYLAKSVYGSSKSPRNMVDFSMGKSSPHGGVGTSSMSSEKSVNSKDIKVDKPKGGYSIEEVYNQVSSLNDKEIKVSGRVVRFSPNIMGSNWLHIQDGSGKEGSNDMTVRTSETFELGSIVTIRGTVKKDFELAKGMVYNVIILDGESVK
ncbi:MAG: hypothetical protein CR982_08390 [Candidatus Cloacimonadota bacterium]|nr:MAG: hypothetical protein CR982_08390 [Candidatus Cloacimonadota bacterium]PIE77900.1 MAG: hypothetical protein CSA15_10670 [Candidatus Delongbacteria bacterium]